MSKRAALYLRVSSDEQTHETYGLLSQITTCYNYAMSKGYTLVGDRWGDLSSGQEVVENGDGWRFAYPEKAMKAGVKVENIKPILCYIDDYTGKRVNRPSMDALRDFVEREGLDAVIPRDTQRFARKRHVAGYLKDWFRRYGVEIDYATQDFEDSAAGNAQEGMHEVFDEWQAEELREKAIRGRRQSAQMGNIISAQPPYGYKIVGERKQAALEIDDEDSKIVLSIFHWYVYGDESGKPLTLTGVAKKLTAMEIPTSWDKLGRKKKSGYGVWSPSSVRTILINPVYIGKWCYGKRRRVRERVVETPDGRHTLAEVISSDPVPREQWIEVEVPAILEGEEGRALFEAARERLKENKRLAKRNNKKNQYLLRGMLVCECGSTMAGTPAPQGDYAYYRCMRKQWEKSNAGRNRCRAPMLRADKADAAMWAEIENRLLKVDNLVEGLREMQAEAERALDPLKDQLRWIEDSLSQCETRLSRALDLYLSSDYPKEWLDEHVAKERKRKEELERARRDLQSRIETARITDEDIKSVEAFGERVAQSLQNVTFEDKRRIVEILRVRGTTKVIDGEQRILGSWLIPKEELIVNVTSPPRCAPCP